MRALLTSLTLFSALAMSTAAFAASMTTGTVKAFDTNTEMYTYQQELEGAANAAMEAAASKRKSRRKPKGE